MRTCIYDPRSFSRLLALISFCLFASPTWSSSSLISCRCPNAKSVCGAASNPDINFRIFKQCIFSKTYSGIPYGIGNFVPSQLFSRQLNKTAFRKAVFDELIKPWLVQAQVCVFSLGTVQIPASCSLTLPIF